MNLRPLRRAGLAIAAVTALTIAGTLIPPVEESSVILTGRTEPVASVSLGCPLLGGESADDLLTAIALPGVADGPDVANATNVVARSLAGAGNTTKVELELSTRGVPGQVEITGAESRAYSVSARGSLAPGLVAEQTRLATSQSLFGLAGTRCLEPDRDFWFVGGSSVTGARTRLVLANPGSAQAAVKVTVFDESGEVSAPALDDILVGAQQSTIIRLDALSAGSSRLAFRVRVREGRLVAGADLRLVDGLDPKGVTWLPVAVAPTRSLVVPAVAGVGDRVVQILNPGQEDAVVTFTVLGKESPYTAVGLEPLTVLARSVGQVDLSGVELDDMVALRLTSDSPITAAARTSWLSESEDVELPDIAVASATPSLRGVTATPLSVTGDAITSLVLSAVTNQSAGVSISVIDAAGIQRSAQQVTLTAGTTRQVTIARPGVGKAPFMMVITPTGAGRIQVTKMVVGIAESPAVLGGNRLGSLLDLVPLVAAPTTVEVPPVGQDPTVSLNR